jgi:hypothetical protein
MRCRLSCLCVVHEGGREIEKGRSSMGADKEEELDGDGAGEDTRRLRQPRRGHARMPVAGKHHQLVMWTSM